MENYYNRQNTKTDLNGKDFLVSFLLIVILVMASVFVLGRIPEEKKMAIIEDNSQAVLNLFNNLELEAQAVFVWDVREQSQIYSRNSESQLPLASLTKVAMALVATEYAPKGLIVTIKNSDLIEEGDDGLLENEKWKLSDRHWRDLETWTPHSFTVSF